MNSMCKINFNLQCLRLLRPFSCTTATNSKRWRVSKGLSANKMSEGVLTDAPDYTFLDGRPTPLLNKQKLRLMRQREYASKIVEMISEVDFAKKRYQDMLRADEEERQRIIANRLKPKGKATLK